jgi:hypothetical protein
MADFNVDVQIKDKDIIEYVRDTFDPEDVFPDDELMAWHERYWDGGVQP